MYKTQKKLSKFWRLNLFLWVKFSKKKKFRVIEISEYQISIKHFEIAVKKNFKFEFFFKNLVFIYKYNLIFLYNLDSIGVSYLFRFSKSKFCINE